MRKSKNKRSHFSMVEIVLAIAILAFGFASVLGLFPVAIKAVRSSQAEGLANDAANNVFAYYKSYANVIIPATMPVEYFYTRLFVDPSSIINWASDNALRIKAKDAGVNNLLYGNNFLEKLKNCDDPTDPTNSESKKLGFQRGMNLFQPERNDATNPPTNQTLCFFLVQGSADFKKTEFTAQIIVWRNKVDRLATPATPAPAPPQFTYEQAVELNMEVSWPINIPYDDREKRYYQFVITNPTP